MPKTARARGRQVNAFQALALLLSFVLVAGLGGVLAAGLALPGVAIANGLTEMSQTAFDDLPTALEQKALPQKSRILASDGTLLATIYHQDRVVVPLDEIAPIMQEAVIATEDRRFYEHAGVDVMGMVRAAARNAMDDDSQEGASTLTQQYVKNVLIEAADSAETEEEKQAAINNARASEGTEGIARKLREAKLAITLEKTMSKDEILEKYLNIAQFGSSVWGVESAAQRYFGMRALKLDYLRAATIAGITKSPSYWDPTLHPERAEKRRNVVLGLMLREKYITQEEYDTGKATPIEDTLNVQTPKRGCMSANVAIAGAGYFCDYVTKVIRNDEAFGKTEEERLGRLYRGGLTIWTTLDKQMQADADKEVKAGVPVDDPSGIGTAMIVVEPGTGQIKAMAQNRIYNNTQDHGKRETAVNFNTDNKYGSASGFPPGSTFKPFTLLQWLKEGHALGETINGTKLKYNLSEFNAPCTNLSGTWEFGNAEGKGAVMTVLQATMNSVNSGYVAMASKINLCDIFTGAAEIGVHKAGGLAKDGPVDPLPANVLGSQSVAPLTMANAFATFAANGVYCQPVAILKATDSNGEELKVPSANCSQKIDEGVAKAMNYALSNVWNGTAKGIARPGFAAAGKTGTTTHNEHTWFVGYTPRLAAAVWVGHTDAMKSMHGLTINGRNYSGFGAGPWGSSIAAPTWVRFMNAALGGGDNPGFDTPPNDLVHGKKISVPNVIGMKENEARSALAARGFQVVVSTQRVPSALEAGRVAEQDPQGWAVAGSVITLRLSDGSQQNWDPCKDDPNRPECKKDDEKGPPGRDRDRGRDDSANRP
ncbi:penicillin-binding protein [Cellulomonas persica]|uniref:Carboxypeptidase n=1 Tax=Cellulomonas persica TaxID=76861 RepID=A0A510UUS3_9CELL|nr:penicillin-binding protein [Cellulomonas persica]GEK18427.1 carboxypeptidase [Cellulomonas persica]